MADTKKDAAAKAKADAKPAAAAAVVKIDPTLTHMAAAWKAPRPLTACRFDPSGKFVFIGTEDYALQRVRVSDGQMTPFVGHESWCRAIGFTPDGRTTLTAGYDGRLLWWDTAADQPKPRQTVAAHDGWIRALAVSPDGRLVATCGNDGLVKFWSVADGRAVAIGRGHGSHVYNAAFHPEGKQLASADHLGQCRVWDVPTPAAAPKPVELKSVREFALAPISKYDEQFRAQIGGARSLAFGAGGKLLAAGGISNVTNAFAGLGNATWVVVDFAAGKQAIVHTGKEKVNGTAWGTAWHPDGYWIGAGGGQQGGLLYFFKPGAAPEFFKFKLPDTARDLALAPDGRSAAVAHADGQLRLYRFEKKA